MISWSDYVELMNKVTKLSLEEGRVLTFGIKIMEIIG